MKKYDCIVVGGGIAGLSAAYKLKKEGKDVLVLESKSIPGGRMISKNLNDEISVNLGAGFALTSYKNLMHTAEELGVVGMEQNYSSVGIFSKKEVYKFNPSNLFSLLSFKPINFNQKIKLILSTPGIIFRTIKCRITNFSTIVSFDTESTSDLFRKIIGKSGVDYLADPLSASLFFYSPDFLSESMLFGMFSYVMKAHFINFKDGLGEIARRMAEKFDVKYDIKVTGVKRGHNRVYVTFTEKDEEKSISTDKVIIAIPGNKVLKILTDPLEHELNFFRNVEYGTHVSAFFKTKERIFPGFTKILFTMEDNYKVSSLNLINVNDENPDFYYYRINFRDDYSKFLMKDKLTNRKIIHASIKENFPEINDVEVVDIIEWRSAIPKFRPGYVKKIIKFRKKTKDESRIFYAGDYLNGPFLEGAFESGLRAVHQVLKSKT